MSGVADQISKNLKESNSKIDMPMRLLVDCHCFDEGENQGLNTYIREMYKSLIPIAEGIKFIFAAQNISHLKTIFGMQKNVDYVRLKSRGKYYRLGVEFPEIVKKHNIDVIHSQYITPLIKNCKTVVTIHDILFEDYPQFFPYRYRLPRHILFKASARRADLLLTVSDYSRRRISKVYRIPEEEIVVTHNGVSADFRNLDHAECVSFIKSKYGIDDYILYVSRFEPRKRQVSLLNAYKNLRLDKKGIDLVFIGIETIADPQFNLSYESCDEEMKQHIHIYDNIPYNILLKWYGGARLFVYPSEAEGFGIPPLEAAASGVPVICNDKTAMADFTFFGKNLISTDNVDLLESRMQALLAEGKNTEEARRIQEDVYRSYSWDVIAKDFKRHLEEKFM